MARTLQQKFYASKVWKDCRNAYVAAHPYCARCKQVGIIKPVEHVHHLKHLTPENVDNPNVSLNWENLEGLCVRCHMKEHYGRQDTSREFYFDENGNFLPSYPPRGEE